MAAVAHVPINRLGRDFVVGDIHGCFSLLDQALRAVNFNAVRDRVFSVGDLVDRGEESPKTLGFLEKPWFYSILGNHEAMVLDLYRNGCPSPEDLDLASRRNGFEWWLDLQEQQQEEIVGKFRSLPVALEIETRLGTVGLVHADVAEGLNWATFISHLRVGDPDVIEQALSGRSRLDTANKNGVCGIDRIFVGHTPIKQPWCLGNVFAIDTGAVFGVLANSPACGRLTMVEITSEGSLIMTALILNHTFLDLRL